MRAQGTVKWFNEKQGFGFVVVDGRDVFVHYTSIAESGWKTLIEGEAVTLRVVQGPKGSQGFEIKRAQPA